MGVYFYEVVASMNGIVQEAPCTYYRSLIILLLHFIEIPMAEVLSQSQKFNILRQMTQRFPFKCKLFLNLLLSQLPQGNYIQTPKDFKKAYCLFTHTFNKFSLEEKLYFIGQISDHIAGCLRNEKFEKITSVQIIQTTCEIKTTMMGINYWEKRSFKYDYQLYQIRLLSSKKDDIIDLRAYLVRKSSSERNSMVLEAIEKAITQKMAKTTIRFKSPSIFQEIFNNIRKGILELTERKIEELLCEDMKESNIEKMTETGRNQKGFTILTTKNMTEYFNKKQKLTEKLNKNRASASMLINRNNTRIYRSHQNKKCYYLEQNISQDETFQNIKQNIALFKSKSEPKTVVFEVLEAFSQNITANYYKLDVGLKEYQFLVINEKMEKEGLIQQTMKTATQFFLDISIEFIIVALKKTAEKQFSFNLSIILKNHSKKSSINGDIINLLIAMAYPNPHGDHLERKNSLKTNNALGHLRGQNLSVLEVEQFFKFEGFNPNQSLQDANQQEEVFTTSSGKKDSSDSFEDEDKVKDEEDDEEQFYSIIVDEEDGNYEIFSSLQEKQQSIKSSLKTIEKTQSTDPQEVTFLRVKALTNCLPPSDLKILREHFLFGEWRKSSKGGMVCSNEAVIKQQKRVVKLVFARIGSNIFKGNVCMNISLPIQVFRTESLLVSIARNLTYAPLIVEATVSMEAVERMKQLIIFHVSMNILSLSVQKPFNPILGETFQGEIAGCPIFMEQKSHHPAISSLLFIGRGYKLYGDMVFDVNLRLNYVKGSNNCIMTLQYDNGDKIKFNLPSLIINGLIMGERTMYWEGTIHIIDQKNLLITEMYYNANNLKKGMFSFKSESPDQLSGEIYKVTPSFMQRFIDSRTKLPIRKEDGAQVVSRLSGEWIGKIFFDDKQAFDFETQLPVELEYSQNPLPSDSVLRSDVIELLNNEMNVAQDEKDRLQEIQRNDRKLRQSKAVLSNIK